MRIRVDPLSPGHAQGRVVTGKGSVAPDPSGPPPVVVVSPGPEPASLDSFRALDRAGRDPSAVILPRPSPDMVRALALAKIPAVRFDQAGALLDGDEVTVDGAEGYLELPAVKEVPVVTAILRDARGHILLLRRSEKVGSFRGFWAGVSGFLEASSPLEQALIEIGEETSLSRSDVRLEREGNRVYARDGARMFVVHPFLFATSRTDIRIDWEHTEFTWVPPSDVPKYRTVPGMDRVFATLGV